MAQKNLPSYRHAVEELEKLAQEAQDLGDPEGAAAVKYQADQLRQWLDSGQHGPCPVDLTKHDLAVESAPVAVSTAESLSGDGRAALADVESATLVEAAPPTELETPEDRGLRRNLTQAHQYFIANELRQAVARSQSVLNQARPDSKLKEEAADLLDRARRKLNKRLDEALKKGYAARAEGEIEEARRYYREARDLDPDNSDARDALLELDKALPEKLSKAEINKLRAALKERYDLQRLGEAVYRGEALEAEEKWPQSLIPLLREAREAYNNIRIAHGEDTTMMRFADLAGRKTARDKIAARMAVGEKVIYDVTLNQLRPASEVLQEADKLLEYSSEDTAQYEIDRVKKVLPAYPRAAQKHLQQALKEPFHAYHKKQLELKLAEVEALANKQEQAERLLTQADQIIDEPVKILGLLLQTQSAFEYIDGLAVRLQQARQTALDTLRTKMETHHKQTEAYLQAEDYHAAREEIAKADALPATWPEEEKPQALLTLLEVSTTLRARIDEQAKLRGEFETLVQAVKEQVVDPNRRQVGLNLLEEMRSDPRFAAFADLRVLTSEMDQYKGIGEQLAEAQSARDEADWSRVYELADKMKRSGKAGQLAKQVEALFEEASLELKIERARKRLDDEEVVEANKILSTLIEKEKDAKRKAELKARLKAELDKIEQCIQDTPPLQTLFAQAKELEQRPDITEQLQALRLHRYVGGDLGETQPEGWPEYKLTLRTAEARRAARELAEKIRAKFLEPLKAAYTARALHPPDAHDLRLMADRARALREAHLLYADDERVVVRWLEVAQGSHEAKAREAEKDWDGAVAIWQELSRHHPREVENELRRALAHQGAVQQALDRAHRELEGGSAKDALRTLKEALAQELTQGSPVLIQESGKIFADAETGLLQRAREKTGGSQDDKIAAVVMLVELRELEDIIGKPDSDRRSTPQLEPLRAELEGVARKLASDAANFDPALQPSLAQALTEADRLSGQLQTFINVARLFELELRSVKENLERRRRDINDKYDRLKRLKGLLEEALAPTLWDSALVSADFETLDRFLRQIQQLDVNVPEAEQFDQRLSEWQAMRSYLSEEIKQFKHKFEAEEDFAAVTVSVVRSKLLPTHRSWQQVRRSDYEHIREVMGSQLIITDIYGGNLVGWEQVGQQAAERQEELEAWTVWDKECERLMDRASNAIMAIDKHTASTTLVDKRRDWKAALATAETVVNALCAGLVEKRGQGIVDPPSPGPQRDGRVLPVRSHKVKVFSEEGKRRLEIALDWLNTAEGQVEAIKDDIARRGFPTSNEFNHAALAKDWDRLEDLLKRARAVGAANEEEAKLIRVFERVLKEGRNPPKPNIPRIFDIFNR